MFVGARYKHVRLQQRVCELLYTEDMSDTGLRIQDNRSIERSTRASQFSIPRLHLT